MHPFLVFKAEKQIGNIEDEKFQYPKALLEFITKKFNDELYEYEFKKFKKMGILTSVSKREIISKDDFLKFEDNKNHFYSCSAIPKVGICSFKEMQGFTIDVEIKKNKYSFLISDNMWLPHSAKYDENGDVKISPEEWQVYFDRSIDLIENLKDEGLIDSYKNNLEIEAN